MALFHNHFITLCLLLPTAAFTAIEALQAGDIPPEVEIGIHKSMKDASKGEEKYMKTIQRYIVFIRVILIETIYGGEDPTDD